MKKLSLITLCALIVAAPFSQAQISSNTTNSFSYIAGGLQYTSLENKVVSSVYFDSDSYHQKSADSLAGLYFRGSWNFSDNLFAEFRSDVTTREALTLTHGLFGVGYFQPINDAFTLYGLAGLSGSNAERDVLNHGQDGLVKVNREDNGLTGEVGARIRLTNSWSIEPALRVADYNESLQELRLGNNIKVSNYMSIELNAQKRTVAEYDEVNYQMGARYTF
ncbi:porin family protein [Photobacterium sp. SDRW27]|uniref:outer membrane beta-barrel protein n=1 Tax=Photobacterium obscurum TaxID=2829490 RepID=UPI002243B6C5|nr:outer membrane beta-barrel protein [Photobacterium obscurum]MCW8329995.1 porin family protein [Photobacterium obscurum]